MPPGSELIDMPTDAYDASPGLWDGMRNMLQRPLGRVAAFGTAALLMIVANPTIETAFAAADDSTGPLPYLPHKPLEGHDAGNLNQLAQDMSIGLAKEVQDLAKSGAPNVDSRNLEATLIPHGVELSVRVTNTGVKNGPPGDPGGYAFYAKSVADPHGNLQPNRVQSVVLNVGDTTQLDFERNHHTGGWQITERAIGGVASASTDPTLPHERRFTLGLLKKVYQEGRRIIAAGRAHLPTDSPTLVFKHQRGENDAPEISPYRT